MPVPGAAAVPSCAVTKAVAQQIGDVTLLQAFYACFRGREDEVNYVDFETLLVGAVTLRMTTIRRGGIV